MTTEWEIPVDEQNKSTEFNPFKGGLHCGKRVKTNPHMRAFWAATLAFTFAFIGWFAFAPLLTVVRVDIGICDNNDEIMALPEADRVKACICKKGCRKAIGNANIAAVSFDVFTRFIMGSVIEKFGPRLSDCMLLAWGTLGGGLTQTIMPLVYRFWKNGVGLDLSAAWRASMFFPPFIYVCLIPFIFFGSQDTTAGKFDVALLGKTQKAGPMTYVKCCLDYRVFLMIFQYSACFGCELVMNNTLATHFHDAFGVELAAAGALAMSFGAMNLFARSLGGIASDWANKRWQMTGRLWAHFVSLLGQAIFLFLFGCITKDS